jgi:hypothetical protein
MARPGDRDMQLLPLGMEQQLSELLLSLARIFRHAPYLSDTGAIEPARIVDRVRREWLTRVGIAERGARQMRR